MGALAELHRILRPGGRLLYAEHGLAPDVGVARWQRRIEPVWKHLFGNCHLTRPVSAGIAAAGFATEVFAARYMQPGPRFAGWMEWGVATKSG
jgi:SAM-dependent methyltransferase